MRNREREKVASYAAFFVSEQFCDQGRKWPSPGSEPIGLILGTGWGDVIIIEDPIAIQFGEIPGFQGLGSLEGHARQLVLGKLAGKDVAVLRGRIHMNEAPNDSEIPKMVRLQTEMLFKLGVRKLIVTSAVGALPSPALPITMQTSGPFGVGEVCAVDGFVSLYAPVMPIWAGEFCSPDDILDASLRHTAIMERGSLVVKEGGHAMVHGPPFEGRRYDKRLLAASGASVVGMSMRPEACVAALYKEEGVRVLGLGFVTNDDVAEHSHDDNLARAKAASAQLGGFLTRIVTRL